MRFHFDEPVVGYMTRDVEVARVDTPVEQIARTLEARGISGVPILDSRGHLVGVVTRTDLIQLGVLRARCAAARGTVVIQPGDNEEAASEGRPP